MLCIGKNIAWETDVPSISYDKEYFDKYLGYEDTPIGRKLNSLRVTLTERYCPGPLLDIGIGAGSFIKASRLKVYGYDVNPAGISWLKDRDLFLDPHEDDLAEFTGFCLWDVLEHLRHPSALLSKLHSFVFLSMPIFTDLAKIKNSKHYRPGEHIWYFTEPGLTNWMNKLGYSCLEVNDEETRAGREAILSFVFHRPKSGCPQRRLRAG